jgi:hypothetical protein
MLRCSLSTKYDAIYKRHNMIGQSLRSILLLIIAAPALCAAPQATSTDKTGAPTVTETKILTAPETAKFLPSSVFFQGQSAPIQARNSSGVQFTKGPLLLVTLVDTAGYSSSVQEKYQAYLITETPIDIGGHRLEPGAYGCGFIAGDNFVVMDIGGHDLFSVRSARDADLRRPTPLQVLPAPDGAGYRLYVGRQYVHIAQASPAMR